MRQQNNGFTLTELLMTVSIIGIMTSITISGWSSFIVSARGYSATNSLRHALYFARSEAIIHNQVVRICASSDGQTCSIDTAWENGWITYADRTGKPTRTPDDPLIYIQPPLKGLIIRKNGREKSVKFNSTGSIGLNRSFSICSSGLKPIIRIVMIHSGRIRSDLKNIRCN